MGSQNRMALHWKILIGLVLGVAVGLAINTMWDTSTWDSIGVGDPAAWVDGVSGVEANADANAVAHGARFVRNLNGFIGELFMR
ncbi:MAG: hypothetical protein JKY43_09240, partial [Phycisphaerales bacterium]|nr:hypothetical protein [Phycisphaerales bacterium]